jgi:hypothetical protein
MNAVGAHELVVDTADHARTWADFSPAHMARLLGVYRAALRPPARPSLARGVLMARRVRPTPCPLNVIATPVAPPRIEDSSAAPPLPAEGRCAFCDPARRGSQPDARRRRARRLRRDRAVRLTTSVRNVGHARSTRRTSARSPTGVGDLATVLVLVRRLHDVLDDPPYARTPLGPLDGSHPPPTTGTGRSSRWSARGRHGVGHGHRLQPVARKPRPTRCERRRRALASSIGCGARAGIWPARRSPRVRHHVDWRSADATVRRPYPRPRAQHRTACSAKPAVAAQASRRVRRAAPIP